MTSHSGNFFVNVGSGARATTLVFPVSRFEFERIDLAMTSLLANQPVASESERAWDQCQSEAVTPPCQSECFVPAYDLEAFNRLYAINCLSNWREMVMEITRSRPRLDGTR